MTPSFSDLQDTLFIDSLEIQYFQILSSHFEQNSKNSQVTITQVTNPGNIYLFEINNKNTRKRCE